MKIQKKTLIIKLMSLSVLGIIPAIASSCFDNSELNSSNTTNSTPGNGGASNNSLKERDKYLYSNYENELKNLNNFEIKNNITSIETKFLNELNPLLDKKGQIINIYEMIDDKFKDKKQDNTFYYLIYANAYLNTSDYESSYFFSLIQIWNNDKLTFTNDKSKYSDNVNTDIEFINNYLNPSLNPNNQNYYDLLTYQIKYLSLTDNSSIQNLQDSKKIIEVKTNLNTIKNFIDDFLNFINK